MVPTRHDIYIDMNDLGGGKKRNEVQHPKGKAKNSHQVYTTYEVQFHNELASNCVVVLWGHDFFLFDDNDSPAGTRVAPLNAYVIPISAHASSAVFKALSQFRGQCKFSVAVDGFNVDGSIGFNSQSVWEGLPDEFHILAKGQDPEIIIG